MRVHRRGTSLLQILSNREGVWFRIPGCASADTGIACQISLTTPHHLLSRSRKEIEEAEQQTKALEAELEPLHSKVRLSSKWRHPTLIWHDASLCRGRILFAFRIS